MFTVNDVFQRKDKMSVARVYVGRLSNYARDRDVERFFKGFGRIRDIMVKNGYCFVVSVHIWLLHLLNNLNSAIFCLLFRLH